MKNKEEEEVVKSNEEALKDLRQSKFEERAIKNLYDDENVDKIARRGYMKAVSKVKIQIQLLKGGMLEKEQEIEEAIEGMLTATFDVDFNLQDYDRMSSKVDKLKEELEDFKATLENRQELLIIWA